MEAFQYPHGLVRGLSPFEYRGKNPDFYKQKNAGMRQSFEVEPKYKFLVPSKWHKTGWKYAETPKVVRRYKEPTDELLTTYLSFYQSPKARIRQASHVPRNCFSIRYTNCRLSSLSPNN